MKSTLFLATITTVLLSAGAHAQTRPDVHIDKPGHKLTELKVEQRAERKAVKKAELAKMTPAERKAFKAEHRQKKQAKLNAMTPEQRERYEERRRQKKAGR